METPKTLVQVDEPPAQMTVGGRTYEILPFLKEGEESADGETIASRAKETQVDILGGQDCGFILEHQSDIPLELRDKATFVFLDWRGRGDSSDVALVYWNGARWVQRWHWLGYGLDGDDERVLRRIS
jgi:hypothetical protein